MAPGAPPAGLPPPLRPGIDEQVAELSSVFPLIPADIIRQVCAVTRADDIPFALIEVQRIALEAGQDLNGVLSGGAPAPQKSPPTPRKPASSPVSAASIPPPIGAPASASATSRLPPLPRQVRPSIPAVRPSYVFRPPTGAAPVSDDRVIMSVMTDPNEPASSSRGPMMVRPRSMPKAAPQPLPTVEVEPPPEASVEESPQKTPPPIPTSSRGAALKAAALRVFQPRPPRGGAPEPEPAASSSSSSSATAPPEASSSGLAQPMSGPFRFFTDFRLQHAQRGGADAQSNWWKVNDGVEREAPSESREPSPIPFGDSDDDEAADPKQPPSPSSAASSQFLPPLPTQAPKVRDAVRRLTAVVDSFRKQLEKLAMSENKLRSTLASDMAQLDLNVWTDLLGRLRRDVFFADMNVVRIQRARLQWTVGIVQRQIDEISRALDESNPTLVPAKLLLNERDLLDTQGRAAIWKKGELALKVRKLQSQFPL